MAVRGPGVGPRAREGPCSPLAAARGAGSVPRRAEREAGASFRVVGSAVWRERGRKEGLGPLRWFFTVRGSPALEGQGGGQAGWLRDAAAESGAVGLGTVTAVQRLSPGRGSCGGQVGLRRLHAPCKPN